MDLIGKGQRHWQEFHNVSDILDFITNDKYINPLSLTYSGANPPTGKNPSSKRDHQEFLQTMELMRHGWPEGRDEISKYVTEIEKRVMGFLPVQEVQYDVQGQWFDVGRYITGEPEVYGSFVDTDVFENKKHGRIIHVVINIDVSWQPFIRGAAGVTIIDALERCGYRVVADGIANSVNGWSSTGKLLETRIRVKNSDEAIQLDKLAFIFAHPNVLEHVLFPAWERLPRPIQEIYNFHHSYGYIGDVPQEDRGDIYVESSIGSYNAGIEEVAKYVLNVLKQNGIKVEEASHG